MSFPTPQPGMVIRYAYLWRREAEAGLEEGRKHRPCAVLLTVAVEGGGHRVYAPPVTHSPPIDPSEGVEIPTPTKRRLGLDDQRSWIVLTEANRFDWPGPDLRPHPGEASGAVYGELPAGLFRRVRDGWLALSAARRAVVPRTD